MTFTIENSRHEKNFKVDRHCRIEIVSTERFKPAHVNDSVLPDKLRPNARPIKPPSGISTSTSDPTLNTSETTFSRPIQQHVSSAPSTNETLVSRPDQQATPPSTSDEIAGPRSTNETTVSPSGRRVRLPVRLGDEPHNQQRIQCKTIFILHACYIFSLFFSFVLYSEPAPPTVVLLVPSTSVNVGESRPDHARSCRRTQ
ncbi:unnamed protein product [Schistosoma curassoni]|uniref:Uncharacterized protein n=1 Tax=Schistosoma curassoni TaxID=6186 RepID=A0A183JDC3_9TREM|nr:unnamed protein product [Schistosoma curassoni]